MLGDDSADVRVALAASAGDMLVLVTRPWEGVKDRDSLTDMQGSSGKPEPQSPPRREQSPYRGHVDTSILPILQRLLHDPSPSVCSQSLRAVANASHSINMSSGDADGGEEVDFVPVLKEKQVRRNNTRGVS